jgi:hypothetical protein
MEPMYLSRRSRKQKTAKWHHRLLCNKNVDFRIERICRFKLISISFSKVSLSETWQSSFKVEFEVFSVQFWCWVEECTQHPEPWTSSWLKDEKRNGLFNGYWTWKSVCPNSLEKRSLCLYILHWESLLAVNSLLLLSSKPTSAELFVVYHHIRTVYIIWSGWWNWLKACRWTLVLSCARQVSSDTNQAAGSNDVSLFPFTFPHMSVPMWIHGNLN